ncbi:hypothetical protein [Lactiplantibacillus pentosus]|jgi:hypothetical protein|uniref:Uncharacterized protein n=2 Tax=Lactiplantibacillus pentosus TaxID=1589 RepID=A0A241RTT6_LACPE|nr:hypothetical protein [Lactiplantibacillus pentosus]CCC18274.1 putative uncharacterized protein lp_2068 [Lactiplantibacillus pentosus IG1]ASG81090.1 hypothetical protein CEW82_15145 [Lactiplantibacillus pentosus]AUI78519.1 hypothetical protein BB562_07395 [Lactiplantibacillus pentosus]AYG37625.1 hypothetical protein CFK27_06560 [Lactiplantibacillus pentosus]AYG40282.1 hypothetical protein CFI14_03710 [Lactiplantibacillus pentosus]
MDFVDLTPIALGHTPLGTRNQLPEVHAWQLDWDKLARLIRDNQDVMAQVEAGLAEDWLNTHGTIWDSTTGYHRYPNDNREFDDTVFWAASTWATPAIVVTFHNEISQAFSCYRVGKDPDFHYLGPLGRAH